MREVFARILVSVIAVSSVPLPYESCVPSYKTHQSMLTEYPNHVSHISLLSTFSTLNFMNLTSDLQVSSKTV
jgi:hypothetical protein